MRKLFTLFLFSVLSLSVLAQGRLITGKVTDVAGNPLLGVTVQLVGSTTGTATDLDGLYKIMVTEGGILRFRYVGFLQQDIPVTNQTTIDVVMKEETSVIDEVVVIGYGTQKKKDLTTAVATVDEKEIKDRPIISAAQALQGKAAGVQITQPSGKPGTSLSVRVRGSTSVLAGNEPLYVIDGVPTTNTEGLNPSDIATMSVLKDASSSAIYGARAANGVVLITTKRGAEGAPVINFNTYFGISRLRKTIDVLDTKQYRDLIDEIMPGSLDPSWTKFGNWSDSVFSTGHNQSYQLSLSGGSDKSKYFLSVGYLSEAGIVKPAIFDRYSVRLNLDNQIKTWLKFGTSINLQNLKSKDAPDNASSGRGGIIMSTLNTPPFLSIYDRVNFYVAGTDTIHPFFPNPFQPSWENPVAYMKGPDQESTDNNILGNVFTEITLIPDLILKSKFGVDITAHFWDYYLDPFRTNYGRQNNGLGRSDKRNDNTWLWENTLDYAKAIGDHNITGLIGSSIQKHKSNDSYIEGNDFPADLSVKTISAANTSRGWTNMEEWALASFFARATYAYKSKYYATASVRRDGSSKLAHRWGTMPSFSLGWRISAEPFMQGLRFIDDLKIRGGWGKNGNQEGIPNYARFGLISYYSRTATNPLSGPAAVQVTYGNPDLRWETTAQTNVGIDLAMFRHRVTLNADAYYKKTSDVLLNVQLSQSLPINTIQTNAGDIENKGFEFSLSTVNMTKKLTWSTDLNMSFNRNKVLDLQYTQVYYFGRIYSNNSDVAIVKKGLPLGSFFGYVSDGVDSETGDLKYKDVNHNEVFDTGDRKVIGNPNPDFVFGLTNVLDYKRFNLNIFFQGSIGNDIYNATRIDLEGMFDSKNQSVAVLRRWTPTNTNTDIPRAAGGGRVDNVRNSTRFVEDGSYVRLKSVTLSYRAIDNNPKFTAIRQLSVYVTGQNLLTFTRYSGFDPEVNAYGNSATELGIDYGTYPQSINVILGVNVQF